MQKIEFYVGNNLFLPIDSVNRVGRILGEAFGGYTKVPGRGYWKGAEEDCVVYTVISFESSFKPEDINALAKVIANTLGEEAVLWTLQYINGGLAGPNT